MSNIIFRLEEWYADQCDGDWEHEFGIKINSIDNPGWKVSIPLERTSLESKHLDEVIIDRSDIDWVHCKKHGNEFIAWGGSGNLCEMIELFFSWRDSG